MSDTLSNLFSHIRNGQRQGLLVIDFPSSKMILSVLRTLQTNGYIRGYRFPFRSDLHVGARDIPARAEDSLGSPPHLRAPGLRPGARQLQAQPPGGDLTQGISEGTMSLQGHLPEGMSPRRHASPRGDTPRPSSAGAGGSPRPQQSWGRGDKGPARAPTGDAPLRGQNRASTSAYPGLAGIDRAPSQRKGALHLEKNSYGRRVQILLKYKNQKPAIQKFVRISKPSQRRFISAKVLAIHPLQSTQGLEMSDFGRPQDAFEETFMRGLFLLSTPKGILSDLEAYKLNVGGELLGHLR